MGFWNNVVSAVKWVGNNVVRPALQVVKQAVNWVERTIDNVYGSIKSTINTVRTWVDGVDSVLSGGYRPQYSIYSTDPGHRPVYEQVDHAQQYLGQTMQYVETLRNEMLDNFIREEVALKRQHQEKFAEAQRQHEKKMQEIAAKQKQTEKLFELLHSINFLLKRAALIEQDERMQQFDNFSRLRVSVVFLRDLTGKLKTVEDLEQMGAKEKEFLQLIEKFILDEIENEDFIKLDNMTRELYHKDLLEFGAEGLLQDYQADFKEKKSALEESMALRDEVIIEIDKFEIQANLPSTTPAEKERLTALQREKKIEHEAMNEEVKEFAHQMKLSGEFLLSIRALMTIAQNYENCTEGELARAREIGQIFLDHQKNKDANLSEAENKMVEKFNNLALHKKWTSYEVLHQPEPTAPLPDQLETTN